MAASEEEGGFPWVGWGWQPSGREVGLDPKKGQLQTQKEEKAFQELGELEQGCGGGNMEDSFGGGGR